MSKIQRNVVAAISVSAALLVAGCGQNNNPLSSTANAGQNMDFKPTDMVHGQPNAPVTIVEYASMTCGHCAHFAKDVWPEFKKKYVDTGKVHYIFREFPLDNLAAAAAMLARCASPANDSVSG